MNSEAHINCTRLDRIGICDWLNGLIAGNDKPNEFVRAAVYGAIALVSQPWRFKDSHCVRLTFRDGEDNSDACGRLYYDYLAIFRFTRNAVSVRWWHDASDEMCGQSVHQHGRLCYSPEKHQCFNAFVEDVEDRVSLGRISGYAYRLGGTVISGGTDEESLQSTNESASTKQSLAGVDLGDAVEEFDKLAKQMW